MITVKRLLFILLSFSFMAAQNTISLSHEGGDNWSVGFNSDVAIGGFQFTIDGATIANSAGGAAVDNGFMVSTSANIVLGFSLTGSTIPAGSGVLLNLILNGEPTGLSSIVFSDVSGNSIDFEYIENDDDDAYYMVGLEDTGDSQFTMFNTSISSLEVGDEIGIFDTNGLTNYNDCTSQYGEILVGAGVWTGDQMNIVSIGSIDMCPFGGVQLAGYVANNSVSVRVYKHSMNAEFETELTWELGTGNFGDVIQMVSEIELINPNACADDNEAVGAFGGCESAVEMVGCEYIFAGIPIYDFCPETCDNCPEEPVFGCMDESACNYNPEVNTDTGCEYAIDNYDCNGNCIAVIDCNGECGGSAIENECGCVDASTGSDENFCYGCTDPLANNFDNDATIDDGSCDYSEPVQGFTLFISGYEDGQLAINLANEDVIGGFQFTISSSLNDFILNGASGGSAEDNGFMMSSSPNGTIVGFSLTGGTIPAGSSTLLYADISFSGNNGSIWLEDIILATPSGNALDADTGNPFNIGEGDIVGCMDESACNYNPDANQEGECEYSQPDYDCEGNFLGNMLSLVNANLDSGTLDVIMNNGQPVGGFQFSLEGLNITGVGGGSAEENGFMVSASGSIVVGFSLTGATIPMGEAVLVTISFDSPDLEFCIANAILSNSSGASLDVELGGCIEGLEPTYGCMDPEACNYDSNATAEGDCNYPEENYDCDGNCITEIDCAGECGGGAYWQYLCEDTDGDGLGNPGTEVEDCVSGGGRDVEDGCDLPLHTITLNSNGDVMYNSSENIGGFQFSVNGGSIISASGGDAEATGFMISASGSTVLGFSMTGASFGLCGMMINLNTQGEVNSLTEIVISSSNGSAIEFGYYDGNDDGGGEGDFVADCSDNYPDCAANYYDCNDVCGGSAEVDECGECGGDGGNIECWDGSIVCEQSECSSEPENIFFSEYIEGSITNKALEIYNGTGSEVNLDGYEIWKGANGGNWNEDEDQNPLILSGYSVDNGDVFVICRSSVPVINECDIVINANQHPMNFNGDDAIGLAYEGVLLDVIGQVGEDPGLGWDIGDVQNATRNHTLLRDFSVASGSTNWNDSVSEWVVFDIDTYDYLGWHGELIVEGCMDPEACNYDESADSPCTYCCEYPEENYDCEGNCVAEVDCAGECDGDAYWQTFCEDTDGDALGNPGTEVEECISGGGRDITDGCDLPDNSITLLANGDVIYNSSEYIGGFQFTIDGGSILSTSGGDAAAAGFMISASETTVLGFSMTGASFGPCGTILILDTDTNNVSGLINLVFSNINGESIPIEYYVVPEDEVDLVADCSDEYPNCAANYYDCNEDCGGSSEVDECGYCGGEGASFECWNGDVVCESIQCEDEPTNTFYNVEISQTGQSQLTLFSADISTLSPGDEIGVFDANGITNYNDCSNQTGELLVGAGVWNDGQLNVVSIGSIDMCPFGGIQLSGYVEGNPVVVKVYKAAEDREYETNLTWNLGTGNFGDVIQSVSSIELIDDEDILGCIDPDAWNYDVDSTLDDGSCLYTPSGFEFEQSTMQAFYFIEIANIDGEDLVPFEDWIGIFRGDVCVGSYLWEGAFTTVPAMGDDGEEWTEGYMQIGDLPTFKIYDASDDAIYGANSSNTLPGWTNFEFYTIEQLNGCIAGFDCAGECGGSAVLDECGECGGENADKDCAGECFGLSLVDDCNDCSLPDDFNFGQDDCGVCYGENADKDCAGECFGLSLVDDCNDCSLPDDFNFGQDDCGVCYGENAGKDCAGECFGLSLVDDCNDCSSPDDFNSGQDDCGVCYGENAGKDCAGECFGLSLVDDCNDCSSPDDFNSGQDDCGVCYGGNDCFGCTDESAWNYDVDSTLDDGSCLYTPSGFEFEQSTMQAFYFIEIANIDGEDLVPFEDWIGIFRGDVCVGSYLWEGAFTTVPAMGDDGEEWTEGYMQIGDFPTFKIYDTSDDAVYGANSSNTLPGWTNFEFYTIEQLNGFTSVSMSLDLYIGANLVSLYTLPEDLGIGNIMASLEANVNGVIGEGVAANRLSTGDWVGSLQEVSPLSGYWIMMNTADEFQLNGSLTDPNSVFSLHYGANLLSYPFEGAAPITETLPDGEESLINGIIGEGVAANQIQPGLWVGSLQSLQGGDGYWFIANGDFEFSYIPPSGGLARKSGDTELATPPFGFEYVQSTQQSFYFIENIDGVKDEDWIIAYHGNTIIGARQWNGQYTDVPAMGYDDNLNTAGYCELGDNVQFKLYRKETGEILDLYSKGDIPSWSQNSMVTLTNMTTVEIPNEISLLSAYPNPFNPSTEIRFTIPIEMDVKVDIVNMQGRHIERLIDAHLLDGYHHITWNASEHASGVYFVRLNASGEISVQKILLMK